MTGHSTCHRVNTVIHLTAVGFKQLHELLHNVLRLSDRHAVAWNNSDVGRCLEHVVSILYRDRLYLALNFRNRGGDAGKA